MKCVRCDDTGLIEYVSGTFRSCYFMRGVMVPVELEATEERPVYRQCTCRQERQVKADRGSVAFG